MDAETTVAQEKAMLRNEMIRLGYDMSPDGQARFWRKSPQKVFQDLAKSIEEADDRFKRHGMDAQ